jgi:sarcosine oxidase subunit gamma
MQAEPASRFIFRGTVEAAGAAFGVVLPNEPCRAQQQGARVALWLGPDEWLVLAPPAAASVIAVAIAAKLAGVPHSLVEISDRNVGLMIAGPGSEDVLSSSCPLDLDVTAFPVGMCTRTLFGKAEIVLWRIAPQSFRLEVARSFLPYVIGLLDLAVRDAAATAHR